ncbi:MAG: type IV pilus modification protein PilV [Cocleimonas sp.]|nr:type IV pilus modification protein PilV [Cocleimonas sp.]
MMPSFPSRFQKGFNLIESMVATLLLAIGLLGVASLQIIATKSTQHSFQQGQASDLMSGLLERMRSNSSGVYAENYNIAGSKSYNCNTLPTKNCEDGITICDTKALATNDLYRTICGNGGNFSGGLKGSLLNSSLIIKCLGGTGTCEEGISFDLTWEERLLGEEGNGQKILARNLSLNTVIAQ